MSVVEIDLTKLSEDQLNAFSLVDPVSVEAERSRRLAYNSIGEGLTDLARASFQLAHVLDGMRNTAATLAVKETGIVQIVNRLLTRAAIDGVEFDKPTLEDIPCLSAD